MNLLVQYYLDQAGRGSGHSVGRIYAHPPFSGVFWASYGGSFVRCFGRVAKAIDSEALVSGHDIVSTMARNTDPNAKIRDTVSRNMADTAHMVIAMLSGLGRKRSRASSTVTKGNSKNPPDKRERRMRLENETSPKHLHSLPDHVCGYRLCHYRVRHLYGEAKRRSKLYTYRSRQWS